MGSPCTDGVEPFLVGLSPSYWSHVPMLVSQLETLSLVNGLLCLTVTLNDHERHLVPVSKCLLVGIVVRAEIRSEFAVYVLDDGTGLVDCVVWTDAAADMFNLVTEGNDATKSSRKVNQACQVGDLVRVLGRIVHYYSHPDQRRVKRLALPSSNSIREVHVQLIECASCEAEVTHWRDCADCTATKRLSKAGDVLFHLGPQLEAQARDPNNLPTDDDIGEWRLFGARCRCRVPYKESLLYCHCHATSEPLDPHFTFRDHLLDCLLKLESLEQNEEELRFQYSALKGNEKLDNFLTLQADKSPTNVGNLLQVTKDRLLRGTLQALREDGIVHLIHAPSDTYLFVTRHRVLEPARSMIPQPPFLKNAKVRLRVGLLSRLSKRVPDTLSRSSSGKDTCDNGSIE